MSEAKDAAPSGAITTAPAAANPFARMMSTDVAAGAVAIESERAVAEAQGKLVIAKRFPRDPAKAYEQMMIACRRPGLAGEAFYTYQRGGGTISGPSIRLAEELARIWSNMEYGLRELSHKGDESEMEAYAWDMETNTVSRQSFVVRHVRDKRGGPEVLRDERDKYEVTANNGARRMRARMLAVLPADFVDAAVAECRRTLASKTEPLADRIRKMLSAFAGQGVSAKMIEDRLGHPADVTTAAELTDLLGIYSSIRDGVSSSADWFGGKPTPAATQATTTPDHRGQRDGGLVGVAAPAAQATPPAAAAGVAQLPAAPVATPPKRGPGRPRKDSTPAATTAAPPPVQAPTPPATPPATQPARVLDQVFVQPGETDEQALARHAAEKAAKAQPPAPSAQVVTPAAPEESLTEDVF